MTFRNFILALEDFIEADYELKLILITLKDLYSPFLTSSDAKEVGCAGQKGISTVLDEVSNIFMHISRLFLGSFFLGWSDGIMAPSRLE